LINLQSMITNQENHVERKEEKILKFKAQ
jgi:hypothetical protein